MTTVRPVVLVTGAGGHIGSALRSALEDRYTVIGLELSCKDQPDCIETDVTDEGSLRQAMKRIRTRYGKRIASVIHLAAYFDFSGEPNPKYDEVNVRGTAKLLQALHDLHVEQFVYASTMLVHAPTQPGDKIQEDSPLGPRWAYPQSKVAAEEAVRQFHGNIHTLILRIAGVYTDHAEVPSLATQIQRIYERSSLSRAFPGKLSHGQSFVHLNDLGRAIRLAVDKRGELPEEETLLIGEPQTESYGALQNLIGRLIHGENWKTVDIPKPLAAAGAWLQDKAQKIIPDAIDRGAEPFIKPFMVELADDHYELDIGRAQARLGWQPRHRLRDELPNIVQSLKHDPAAWYRANRIPLPAWLEPARDQAPPGDKLITRTYNIERKEHQRTLWCHFANAGLGLWLATSPFMLGYAEAWMRPEEPLTPTGRGLEYAHSFMTASDMLTGLAITVFALLSLARDFGWARWATAGLGVWLLFAPLLFWTPSAAAYANANLLGALVAAFAVAIPPAPGVSPIARASGPDVPPGWDSNPSSWGPRVIIVMLALVGLLISRHLAAYQLGHIGSAWDPFFGEGTERIITSSVSEAWPVADAGLGVAVYFLEVLTGIVGGRRRWRTMPWLVLLFGLLIVPLGVVSIFFIIIQPVWIGTWCTLCLIAAAAMLLQIPYSLDEILATLQFLKDRWAKGRPMWHVFFRGDTMEGGRRETAEEAATPVLSGRFWSQDVNLPWSLALCIAIGAALMSTRLLFGTEGTAANSDHIAGSLVITLAVIALAEVARPLRLAIIPFGLWVACSPWLIGDYAGAAAAANLLAGSALAALACPRGPMRSHYGPWNKVIRHRPLWRQRVHT